MKDDWWLKARRKPKEADAPAQADKAARLRDRIEWLEGLLTDTRRELAVLEGGTAPPPPTTFPDVMEEFFREIRAEQAAKEAAEAAEAAKGIYPHVGYTWKERILQVVQAHGSPMTCKEIVAGYDLAFPGSWATNLYNTVSVVVSKMARSGALEKVPRPGVAGIAYAAPGQANTYINPNIP